MKGAINDDTYVYCTNCFNFKLCDEGIPYCSYEDKCEIRNCEDSMRFKFRPYYKPNYNPRDKEF